ncbi:hypothetical protein D3C77_259310 [compost metagenome]
MKERSKPIPEYEEILAIKRRSRDRLIKAVYAADRECLEFAAEFVKSALRGQVSIARPKLFSNLDEET